MLKDKITGFNVPQAVEPTDSPTFAGVTVSGLTASKPVGTDANKALASLTTTGSGAVALATSPAFTTPAIGTPSAGVLTSCTGLPAGGATFTATDKLLGRATAEAGVGEEVACTAAGRALLDDADASTQRATLGLGTIATQAANNVAISGGAVTGITDLVVADGGTGVSTLAINGILFGNTANAVQATAAAASSVLVTSGANVPSLATDIPTAVTIGAKYIYRAEGTDIPVADGGTGVSTLAVGGLLTGNTASAVQVLAPGATTTVLVGGGAGTAPVWTTATGSGAPVRETSPTLVTPALGTPASGTLTSCTGLPTAGLATQVFVAGVGVGGAAAGTGGVAFPATAVAVADANTLDDYEEGTFTPAIAFGGGTTGITYGTIHGRYTKIGNRVLGIVQMQLTAKGSSAGALVVTGLPFTAAAHPFAISIQPWTMAYVGMVIGTVAASGTTINLYEYPEAGVPTTILDSDCADNTGFQITFIYEV